MVRRLERRKVQGSAYRRTLAEVHNDQIYFELLMNTLKNSKTIEGERGNLRKIRHYDQRMPNYIIDR